MVSLDDVPAKTRRNGQDPGPVHLAGTDRHHHVVLVASDALDLIAARRFSYAPLITHRFGLDEVDRAYELMEARPDGFVKAILEPQ